MRLSFLRRSNRAGFSLMEVAIAMTVLGLLMSGFLAGYRIYQKTRAENVTQKHITMIEEAVGTFYVRHGRYPVPMPFRMVEGTANYGREGTSLNTCSGAAPTDMRVCQAAGIGGNVLIGVVPFMDLNLAEEAILDGWGNRFTFAVSRPLTTGVIQNTICVRVQGMRDGTIANFNCLAADTQMPSSPVIPVEDMVLVSHGRDGHGAWTNSGTVKLACNTAIPNSGGAQGAQEENCDFDGEFLRPREVVSIFQNVHDTSSGTILLERPTRYTGTAAAVATNFNDDIVTMDIKLDQNYWSETSSVVKNKADLRVGIGTTEPARNVDVNGSVKATAAEAASLCKDQGATDGACFDAGKIADTGMKCEGTAYMSGIANADVYCEPPAPSFQCTGGYVIVGIDSDGRPICQNHSNPTQCVATTQTRNTPCPAGQVGNIAETRSYQCPAGTWTAWTVVTNSCVADVADCAVMPGASYGTCVSDDAGGWLCCELDGCTNYPCQASYP